MLIAAWIVSLGAVIGGALVFVAGLIGAVLLPSHYVPLVRNRPELLALEFSILLACIGCFLLFTLPVYSGTNESKTFIEVNGPYLIPFFIAPLTFAVFPLLFFRVRFRPAIEGLCAFLLGVQTAVGMSGYGLFFGPSGIAMVLAGILSIKSNTA
jgi:glucan phosphoethanolaminetransferase (alkaline phosphatase superfamily)